MPVGVDSSGQCVPGEVPKLFGGNVVEYLKATGSEIPLIVSSCVRAIDKEGELHRERVLWRRGSDVSYRDAGTSLVPNRVSFTGIKCAHTFHGLPWLLFGASMWYMQVCSNLLTLQVSLWRVCSGSLDLQPTLRSCARPLKKVELACQ